MEFLQEIGNIQNVSASSLISFQKEETDSSEKFCVKLPVFDGHFEVLLSLIEKEKVDICDISLTAITIQYLEYLTLCQCLDLDYSSEFLLIISYLLESKSKKLLPIEEEEEIEEIADSLVDHVAQYKIFKQVAKFLKDRKEEFSKIFHRFRIESATSKEKQYFLKDVEIFDLVSAFRRVWAEANEKSNSYEIIDELITVEEKIKEISERVSKIDSPIEFDSLFKTKSRIEIIVTFLAILELIRLRKIFLKQETYFGKILIFAQKSESNANGTTN